MCAAIARLRPVWPPSVGRIALDLLVREHLVEHLDGERLDVGRVGELRIGHDRRRIRVDEDDAQALLAERLARLGAGVVELAGLADHDRPRPDDQDRLEIRSTWHRAFLYRIRVVEGSPVTSASRARARSPRYRWMCAGCRDRVPGARRLLARRAAGDVRRHATRSRAAVARADVARVERRRDDDGHDRADQRRPLRRRHVSIASADRHRRHHVARVPDGDITILRVGPTRRSARPGWSCWTSCGITGVRAAVKSLVIVAALATRAYAIGLCEYTPRHYSARSCTRRSSTHSPSRSRRRGAGRARNLERRGTIAYVDLVGPNGASTKLSTATGADAARLKKQSSFNLSKSSSRSPRGYAPIVSSRRCSVSPAWIGDAFSEAAADARDGIDLRVVRPGCPR